MSQGACYPVLAGVRWLPQSVFLWVVLAVFVGSWAHLAKASGVEELRSFCCMWTAALLVMHGPLQMHAEVDCVMPIYVITRHIFFRLCLFQLFSATEPPSIETLCSEVGCQRQRRPGLGQIAVLHFGALGEFSAKACSPEGSIWSLSREILRHLFPAGGF